MAKLATDGGGAASPATSDGMTIGAAVGWGILFLVLVAMTDIPATQTVAAMFAWLFLVAVLMKFGPAAFGTIKTINTTKG